MLPLHRALLLPFKLNPSIHLLQLARNPLTVEGAIVLLNSITRKPENRLEDLDISVSYQCEDG